MTRRYPSNTWIISIPFTHQSAKLVPYAVMLACLQKMLCRNVIKIMFFMKALSQTLVAIYFVA